jgi:hypothetical protein
MAIKSWLPVKMIACGGLLLVRKTHPTMLPVLSLFLAV